MAAVALAFCALNCYVLTEQALDESKLPNEFQDVLGSPMANTFLRSPFSYPERIDFKAMLAPLSKAARDGLKTGWRKCIVMDLFALAVVNRGIIVSTIVQCR